MNPYITNQSRHYRPQFVIDDVMKIGLVPKSGLEKLFQLQFVDYDVIVGAVFGRALF